MRMRMDSLTCIVINGPVTIFTILANAFFIYCMVCPLHGGRIKQPLKLLLGSIICCTVSYLMSAIVLFFTELTADNWFFILVSNLVCFCSLSTSMSSTVWLNFFYYTQIVPAQRAVFIWIKKNIKSIIYCIWLVERIYSFLNAGVMVMSYLTLTNSISDGFGYNFTMYNQTIYVQIPLSTLRTSAYVIAVYILRAYIILCLCVMVMSSSSTVVYLCRHMRRMVANGQPVSGPRFRGQVRVTVTGLLQGVLYVICAVWTMYWFFSQHSFTNLYIHFTVINLYMSGTTLNLGAGQAVFRQRAADIWLRAARCHKAPQVQQSE